MGRLKTPGETDKTAVTLFSQKLNKDVRNKTFKKKTVSLRIFMVKLCFLEYLGHLQLDNCFLFYIG